MPRKRQKTIRKTFTYHGKTIDRTFSTKAEANEWYDAMKKRSDRVKAGLPVAMQDMPFKVGAARWIVFRSKTSDYWREDERKMRKCLVPALGDRSIQSLTKTDCEAALHSYRLEENLSGATFNRYRTCLHAFFEFIIEEGYRETNPVSRIDKMAEVKRGAHIPNEQVRAYLERAREEKALWFFPFMVLAMNAGPRTGELLGFVWSDYRPELKRMEITRRYQVQLKRIKDGTKGGGGRYIPLNSFAIEVFEEYRGKTPHTAPKDFIFHRKDGRMASPHTLAKIHRRVAKDAKVPDSVRLYDITRHKFASEITARYGLRAAQALLGHASSQTTERYAHNDPDHLINRAVDVVVGGPEKKEKP